MTMKRAYALLELKAFNDEERTFEGIASTISVDRMSDIVEPRGAQFKLPMPFLWQHDTDHPIGHVTEAKVSDTEITVRGKLARVDEPPSLKDELDRAWAMLKAKLVRGLSIGFSPIEWSDIKGTFGVRFTKWDWLELSAVTIPANAEATIQAVKRFDAEGSRAALGTHKGAISVTQVINVLPGASGASKRQSTMNIREQIQSFEATRAAKEARRTSLMEKAAETGVTLDAEQEQEYDELSRELKQIDGHLKRLSDLEAAQLKRATTAGAENTAVVTAGGENPGAAAAAQRSGVATYNKTKLEKGTSFVRYAMALAATKGVRADALEFAAQWKDQTPEVFNAIKNNVGNLLQRSAMAAGTTTDSDWAEPLVEYQTMASEFIDLLRPETIIGKMPRLRRVPFNIRVAGKTQSSTMGWVGQGAPKPVSELKYNEVTMGFAKAAGIVVISQELARFSAPSAEANIRQDMIDTMRTFLDGQFIDPSVAAVANVSPASITNGILAQRITSTGSTLAQIYADVEDVFGLFITAKLSVESAVWVMRPETALSLSLKRTSQDVLAFPGITVTGGTFFGLPVITSQSVPSSVSGGTIIVLVAQNEIFLADDGQVRIDVSEQASLQMDSAPSAGAQSLVSLWQDNLIGIRAERFINWQRRRDTAVAYIDAVNY